MKISTIFLLLAFMLFTNGNVRYKTLSETEKQWVIISMTTGNILTASPNNETLTLVNDNISTPWAITLVSEINNDTQAYLNFYHCFEYGQSNCLYWTYENENTVNLFEKSIFLSTRQEFLLSYGPGDKVANMKGLNTFCFQSMDGTFLNTVNDTIHFGKEPEWFLFVEYSSV